MQLLPNGCLIMNGICCRALGARGLILMLALAACGRTASAQPQQTPPAAAQERTQERLDAAALQAERRRVEDFQAELGELKTRFDDLLETNSAGEIVAANLTELTTATDIGRDLDVLAQQGTLRELWLGSTPVAGIGAESLAGLKGLRVLSLHNTRFTDDDLAHVAGLTKLEELYLSKNLITDEGLRFLAGLENLRVLTLDRNEITSAGLRHIASLKKLKHLYLGSTLIDDEALKLAAGMPALNELYVDRSNITDAGLAHLSAATQLTGLGLHGNPAITDAGIESLRPLRGLDKLILNETGISDASLEVLAGFSQLRLLSVINCEVSDAAVKRLMTALPYCRVVR